MSSHLANIPAKAGIPFSLKIMGSRLASGCTILFFTLGILFSATIAHAVVFNPKSMTLPNGLQVVVVTNHRAPVVTHMMWIKAGAADEEHGVSGIAHYLEHLMFKGTTKVPNGEYSRRIARVGGNENAFTSWDYTAFFATVAKEHLPMVMDLESDRLVNLNINKDLAVPELAVVLDERRQRIDDDPYAPLTQQMNAALHPHHPYGTPVIGWKEEIEKVTVDDAKRFYSTWYQPANTVVVVSGDVEPEDVFALAKKYYGALSAKPVPPRSRVVDPPFTGKTTIVLDDARVKEITLERAIKAPSRRINADMAYDLEMLQQLLAGSDAAYLPKILIQEKKLASSIDIDYDADPYDMSDFTFTLVPRPDVRPEELLAALDEALKTFAQKPVSDDEIKSAARGLQRQAILARDSVMGPAQTIGSLLAAGESLDMVESWPERIGAVKAENVQKALKALLESPSVTGLLKPAAASVKGNDTPTPPPHAGGVIR